MTAAVNAVAADIEVVSVADYWDHAYLEFANYSVSDRAVPFADSGLKPVQQRIMYAAEKMGATPSGDAPKTQKLASTVSGDYHPHGDASVSETIALMAANYQRMKLLDGKGAFPIAVGESPASPRYTHAKLSVPGYEMVRDLREGGVVDFVPTYDERLVEPVTLPSRIPTLLVYGCPKGSIAVGWASTVPAHNPREILAAARAILENPDLSDDDLCALIPGPDWGSGGKVVGTGGIRDYITTGRGALTVSAVADIDGKDIRITQLPPGVPLHTESVGVKSAGGMVGSIRQAALDGKIPGISDVSNLSGFDGVNITVTCKRGHNPEDVLEQLRAHTLFETTFHPQIVALDDDRLPRLWSVRELLEQFLSMRDKVVARRSQIRRDRAAERQSRVRGLLAIQVDIDAAIAIIRDSDTDDEAMSRLMERFEVDESQAGYVMEQKLRALKRSDELKLQKEDTDLSREIAHLERLISSKAARRKEVGAELVEVEKIFAGPEFDRRTVIDTEAVPFVRARSSDGSGAGPKEGHLNPRWKLDDRGVFSDTHGTPLSQGLAWAVWTDGRVKLTDGKGLPVRMKDIPIAPDISGLVSSGILSSGEHLVLVTRGGNILRLDPAGPGSSIQGIAGNGVAGVKLAAAEDTVVAAFAVTDLSSILAMSEKAFKVLAVSDVPVKGRGGLGVKIWPVAKDASAELTGAHVSTAGFIVNDKPRQGAKRPSPAIREKPDRWSQKDPG